MIVSVSHVTEYNIASYQKNKYYSGLEEKPLSIHYVATYVCSYHIIAS